MRRKIPALTEALTGHFDAGHAQLARSMLARIEAVEAALAELNAVIAEAFRPWAHQLELLQTIPGVEEKVAQVIIAETGADMSRFPTPEHLASWAGGSPGTRESAGKRYPVRPPHGNKWLTAMLVPGRRLGRAEEGRQLPGRAARETDQPPRQGPRPTRRRPLDPGLGLLDAAPRPPLRRPRTGVAGPPQRRGPRP